MRTPDFWSKPAGFLATTLRPLGAVYGWGTARRVARAASYQATCPVICIGNINAGGTGKTPTTVALAERLQSRDKKAVILSRGYGGTATEAMIVDPSQHTAGVVGDEPLFMAGFTSVIVAKDRVEGAKLAQTLAPDVILMDDGFQSPALHKDLSIVVVDALRGFGNGLCIPAGPLREPAKQGLKRADFLLSLGELPAQDAFAAQHDFTIPHLTGALIPLSTGMPWAGLPAYAFAGIGHPEKFFNTLRAAGVDLRGTQALADHEPISAAMLERLRRAAIEQGAQLVTTEKDAARLPAELRPLVLPFPVRLALRDWFPLDAELHKLGL
ncbi:MAG: tetraacyldisaccharide 4'-kinase [Planktomarina sp.]